MVIFNHIKSLVTIERTKFCIKRECKKSWFWGNFISIFAPFYLLYICLLCFSYVGLKFGFWIQEKILFLLFIILFYLVFPFKIVFLHELFWLSKEWIRLLIYAFFFGGLFVPTYSRKKISSISWAGRMKNLRGLITWSSWLTIQTLV